MYIRLWSIGTSKSSEQCQLRAPSHLCEASAMGWRGTTLLVERVTAPRGGDRVCSAHKGDTIQVELEQKFQQL